MNLSSPLALRVLGYLSIAWGVIQTAYLAIQLNYPSGGIPPEVFSLSSTTFKFAIWVIVLNCYFIWGGIGILRFQSWGRSVLKLASIWTFLLIFGYLLIFGNLFITKEIFNQMVGYSLFALLVSYLVHTKEIAELLPKTEKDVRRERNLGWSIVIICVSMVVMYASLFFLLSAKMKTPLFTTVGKKVIKLNQSALPNSRVEKFYSIELSIPKDWQVEARQYDFKVTNSDKNIILLVSNHQTENILSSKAYGVDGYTFYRRLLTAKIGAVPLVLRSLMGKRFNVLEIMLPEWKGFLSTAVSDKGELYDFALWHRKADEQINLIFVLRNHSLKENQIDEIVSTIKLITHLQE